MKKIILSLMFILIILTGCTDDQVVNKNINTDSKNFKVPRRVILFNGITDKYLFTVEGYCTLTVKVGQVTLVKC